MYLQFRKNLLPTYILREERTEVHEWMNIQVKNLTMDNPLIYFPETGFRILMSLLGTFSYFNTSRTIPKLITEMEEVYIITPSVCNTQCDTYAENEEIMIDWEGNMIEKPNREQIFM